MSGNTMWQTSRSGQCLLHLLTWQPTSMQLTATGTQTCTIQSQRAHHLFTSATCNRCPVASAGASTVGYRTRLPCSHTS
jgi:hypothetical protein